MRDLRLTDTVEAAGRALARPAARRLHTILRRHGWIVGRHRYDLPIPTTAEIDSVFGRSDSEMVGIEIDAAAARDLFERTVVTRLPEFREVMGEGEEGVEFELINGSFMAVDAHVYYALIRAGRPRRIIEIGAGQSTIVAAAAVARNESDGAPCFITAIDPYPPRYLAEETSGSIELVQLPVQQVPLENLTDLVSGDILFIDSTHALRTGGDVHFELCELLPRLGSGVLVHFHDISLPKPYPRVYFDQGVYWNEQYALQAFLGFNHRFEIIWPGNYMMKNYPQQLLAAIPEIRTMRAAFPSSEPTSFWLRVRG